MIKLLILTWVIWLLLVWGHVAYYRIGAYLLRRKVSRMKPRRINGVPPAP